MTWKERLQRMCARWNYPPDEVEEAFRLARQDVIGWQRLIAHDEKLVGITESHEAAA